VDLGLEGKRVIVTGGSRGIGRAIASAFLDEGARVAICARGGESLDEADPHPRPPRRSAWSTGRVEVDIMGAHALVRSLDGVATTRSLQI
jgi:NAD(P)-dependent dehydrogenase (short-subunit alcohol dehydrogenase family)